MMTPTQHPIAQEELMAYLDGEIPAGRAAEIAAHVEHCMECSALVSDIGSVSERLVEWQVEASSERLNQGVSEAAEKRFAKDSNSEFIKLEHDTFHIRPSRIMRWVLGLSLAGAVLMILFAISMPNLLKSRQAANWSSRIGRERQLAEAQRSLAQIPMDKALGETQYLVAPNLLNANQRMIARTANLSIVAKDFDTARAAIERIALQHQGYVAKLDASVPTGTARTLSASLRIPANQLDAALAELKKQGRVVQESLSGEEVTKQYTDLTARLSNARVTEQRLTAILANRTGKVSDVLEVEQEIARVRGEIERMDAERKNLENRVSYSTVEVSLTEDYMAEINPPAPSTGTQVWNAAVEGYRTLAGNVLGLLMAMLQYGPALLFWVALLFFPARFVWRRLRLLGSSTAN